MRLTTLIVGALALPLAAGAGMRADADSSPSTRPQTTTRPVQWAALPLVFSPNLGQFDDPQVRFAASSGPLHLQLRRNGMVARLGGTGGSAVHVAVRGARPVTPTGLARAAHVLHVYPGSDPSSWQEGAATFASVRYPGLLRGIDMVVHGHAGALEYDFEVQPGADPAAITVDFRGQQSMRLTPEGDLRLDTPHGAILQKRPVAYQVIGGARRDVPARFVVDGEAVRFALGAYDRQHPLVIDPEVSFASYLGTAADDFFMAIDATPDGALLVARRTDTISCVTRVSFSPAARADYTTCLGTVSPFASTVIRGVHALDDGAVALVGTTDDPAFPTTPGAYDRTCSCEPNAFGDVPDAFVSRLAADGTLRASTFLGEADESEFMREVRVDPVTDAVVIAGQTDGRVFPVVGGPATVRTGSVARSGDALNTWSRRGPSRMLNAMAVSPADPDTLVVASNSEILTSSDGGLTWTRRVRLRNTSSRQPRFLALAWAPDGRAVYAGSEDDQQFRRSTDGGATWTFSPPASRSRGGTYSIGVTPNNPALVLICNEVGLQRSVDHGASFQTVQSSCGAIGTTPGPVVYMGGTTAHRSSDGGLTWTPITNPDGAPVAAIQANPADPTDVIAAIDESGTGPSGSDLVVYFRSRNAGQTWTRLQAHGRSGGLREADIVFDRTVPGRVYLSTTTLSGTVTTRVENGQPQFSPLALRRLTFAPSAATTAYRLPRVSPSDLSVVRLSPDLGAITYTAVLSSSDTESFWNIALQRSGHIVLAGAYGADDGPATRQLSPTPRSNFTSIVARLDPSLPGDASADVALINEMNIVGAVVDANDEVVIAGSNRLSGIGVPAAWTAQGFQPTINSGLVDALVLRLSADMRRVLGGTYVGGPLADFAAGLDLDAGGAIYLRMNFVTGGSLSHLATPQITPTPGTASTAYVRLTPSLTRLDGIVYSAGMAALPAGGPNGVLYLVGSPDPAGPPFPTNFVRAPLQAASAGGRDSYVMRVEFGALAPRLTLLGPSAGSAAGGTVLRVRAEGYTGPLTATIGGQPALVTQDGSIYRLSVPPLPPGTSADVRITYGNQTLTLAGAFLALGDGALGGDADRDGLPDAWEARYSLDPTRNDAALDADGDGVTNAQELAGGTHPTATFARYLAEGAQSDFFSHRLALVNAGAAPVTAVVRAFTAGGEIVRREVVVEAQRRLTLDAAAQPELVGQAFGSEIEASAPLVVERTMKWNGTGYGSHSETATPAAAPRWYFAEGATTGAFDLFYLLQNPGNADARVKASYLLTTGQVLEKTYVVRGRSRFNIWADLEEFATPAGPQTLLAAAEFSAVFEVTSGPDIIAERAMYLSNGEQFSAGHQSAGITATGLRWFLAEGATGSYFDLFVLIGNPGTTAAQLTATYLLPDGSTRTKAYTVAPRSRFNIWVDEEQFPEGSGHRALADTAVSVVIESTNGVPVVVERAMWWPGPTFTGWSEAHNSVAMRVTSARWGVADGEVGAGWATGDCSAGAECDETYVLVANTGAVAGTVRATLLFEDAAPEVRTFPIAANSRLNIAVRDEFPSSIGKRVGMIVESVGDPLPLVVERATYGNAGGRKWAAGANAPGTPLP